MNTQDYIELEDKFGANNYHPLDLVIKEANGVWLTDIDNNKYLDCLAAYSAVNQGHCHPKILNAFIEQAKKVTLTSRAFRNEKLPLFYKKLNEITGYEMALPMNTGAEAVETAIKVARRWGYRVKGVEANKAEIIAMTDNFHGRTTTLVSLSTENSYRSDFGPFTPGFEISKYGDIEDLKSKITKNTVGIILEPIQGEAGIIIPKAGYLKAIENLCQENNILFICDEIQSGLGRSGKLFAYQYEDVTPDLLIIGKALSGGFYPVSAVLGKKEVLSLFEPGSHGSTYGGNSLAAAVAIAALDVLIDENLIENSLEIGNYLKFELNKIDSDLVKEVRGRGLWIGLELNKPARSYCEKLMAMGLLCKDTHTYTIRLAPPLTLTMADADFILERIKKVLN
jgi:ornithine--oxo-acid transaminase